MKTYKRKAIFEELKEYCSFAKPNDFIEITYWNNSDGFDAHISSNGEQKFSLTWGQYELLRKLVKKINT